MDGCPLPPTGAAFDTIIRRGFRERISVSNGVDRRKRRGGRCTVAYPGSHRRRVGTDGDSFVARGTGAARLLSLRAHDQLLRPPGAIRALVGGGATQRSR